MALTKTFNALTKTTCKPKTCPNCGGQECFERPRFFCGQLLTDVDLEAAQRYVIEKNRLHNRYLVGTGVVCGLAVRCDPCDGIVTLEPGYAIDCCGNDIVVCDTHQFNVVEYIKNCLRDDDPGCNGKIQTPPTFCGDEPKQYCLYISYSEIHTRPVAAMVRDSSCAATRCEPSRTSEVFRLDLVEDTGERDGQSSNDFWTKARACLREFFQQSRTFHDDLQAAINKQPAAARHTALKALFCRVKADILRAARTGANVRCNLKSELLQLEDAFPVAPEDSLYQQHAYNVMFRLYGWMLQNMLDCICDALLVPCLPCGDEEGVLLACLTVRDGKIEKICNAERQQVVTAPALRYWLHPLYKAIGNLVEYLCCELNFAAEFDSIFRPREPTGGTVPAGAGGGGNMTAGGVKVGAMRAETLLDMAEDYSAGTLHNLRIANFLYLTEPNAVTAMDVYGLTPSEATQKLSSRGINVAETQPASEADAFSIGNLFRMAWVIPAQSYVNLVVSPENLVTAIRFHNNGD